MILTCRYIEVKRLYPIPTFPIWPSPGAAAPVGGIKRGVVEDVVGLEVRVQVVNLTTKSCVPHSRGVKLAAKKPDAVVGRSHMGNVG